MDLTAPCMMWVCYKTEIERHTVFTIECATILPGPVGLIETRTLEEWIKEQVIAIVEEKEYLDSDALVRRDSGLFMILGSDNIA